MVRIFRAAEKVSDHDLIVTDGAGLACGAFEHFLDLRKNTPKVLGATHFHEIFENGFLGPRPSLKFGHMEIRIDLDEEVQEHQITYLYKSDLHHTYLMMFGLIPVSSFREGRSTSSFGNRYAIQTGD